jgi:hypothetical protein
MSGLLEKITSLLSVKQNPGIPKELEEIISLLQSNPERQAPEVALRTNMIGTGVSGEYSPMYNKIGINPISGTNPKTLSHELTHALDDSMGVYEAKTPRYKETPMDSQFFDARKKLRPGNSNLQIPHKDEEEQYRHSERELRAFGVGNHTYGPKDEVGTYKTNPHIDATMATDAAVLRELFKRALESRNGKK